MSATLAGAPVSFGVFELTPDTDDLILPTADEVCATLQETGYVGIDSGPIGFLGRGAELRERLATYGLELCGGWVDLPFSDDAAFAAAEQQVAGVEREIDVGDLEEAVDLLGCLDERARVVVERRFEAAVADASGSRRHVLRHRRPAAGIEGVAGAASGVRLADRVTGISERGQRQA